MAVSVVGCFLVLLLSIISLQLRGLRKLLQSLTTSKPAQSADAELPLEAWLQELEAKGVEILQQLENQRREVVAVRSSVPHPGLADEVVHNQVKDTSAPAEYHTAEEQQPPDFVGEEKIQVQSWVRKPTPTAPVGRTKSSHTSRPGARRQMGQDWQDMQHRVVELAEQGASAASIARTLGVGQGEVQLILRKTNTPTGRKSAERL